MLRTLGSVFSGVGGFELGLHPLGIKPEWQVEQDLFCRKVLQKHWPDVHKFTKIENIAPQSLPCVDIIAGGFPCQSVSISGKQKGSADSRWLWPEFFRIVRYVRPKYVIIENVPGLLTTNGGKDFATILNNLAEIRYDAEWECIPANSIGARHKRNRLFIVAYPKRFRLEKRQVFDQYTFTKLTTAARNSSFYGGKENGSKNAPKSRVRGISHGLSAVMDRALKTRRTVSYKNSVKINLDNYTYCNYVEGVTQAAYRLGKQHNSDMSPEQIKWAHQCMYRNDFWGIEPPGLTRVVGNIPHRKQRLIALGNAVVPQVITCLGTLIQEHYSEVRSTLHA